MNPTRRIAFALAAFAVALGTAGGAAAQTYPSRPIRMIVPTTAGSPDRRDGAAGGAGHGAEASDSRCWSSRGPAAAAPSARGAVITAEPDGYTLLFTEGGKHLMTPALYDNVGFDPVTDLAPVATAGAGSFVLVVAPAVPAKSVQEFVAYARANPDKVNFGFGQGTLPQLVGETLEASRGSKIANIPYKGGAQAVADMLGGRMQMNFGTIATLLALIRQGKLRALAVTGANRNPELPDVPTMAESGFPQLTIRFWMGAWAPPRTPAPIVERLNASVADALKLPRWPPA